MSRCENGAIHRPFYPGVIGSTHLFTADYLIGKNLIGSWTIDLRRRTIGEKKMAK